jgi:ketosteroid isomerase-like protein
MKRASLLLVGFAVALASSCTSAPPPAPAPPPDEHAAAEAAIRAADEEWAQSAAANNVETWLSHYSDDVAVLPPNEPMAVGKNAARKTMEAFLATPGLKVTWKTQKVEAAKSGELGYVYGTYEMSFKDAKGKPMSDHGKYVEAWRKQSDGSWKCVADIFNTDVPMPAAK